MTMRLDPYAPEELGLDQPIIKVTETVLPPFGQQAVIDAYMGLMNATEHAYQCGEWAIQTKLQYEEAKLAGLADGTITGSNGDLREADAQAKLPALYNAWRAAETDEREAKNALELAKLHVERLKLELRLAEHAARQTSIEF
jgi:hypothetical protein